MDQPLPEPPTTTQPPIGWRDRLPSRTDRSRSRTPAKRRRKRTQRIAVIAGTAALTTAVSGIVGGVVSPDRVESVLGLSDDPSASASRVGPRVRHRSLDPSPDAPDRHWSSSGSRTARGRSRSTCPSVAGDRRRLRRASTASPARAWRSGRPGPDRGPDPSDETICVAASTQAFDDLNLAGLDDAQVTAALPAPRGRDVPLEDGCVPTQRAHARARRRLDRRRAGVAGLLPGRRVAGHRDRGGLGGPGRLRLHADRPRTRHARTRSASGWSTRCTVLAAKPARQLRIRRFAGTPPPRWTSSTSSWRAVSATFWESGP